ncbi:YegP family protein [Salidesulfovibrio onnuriiensis]|uniref:YegP family protein n=1 Tax=Salidesulfovibrio onnuriiensis TaxID=2583823 RepID=UPI0011C85E01|nr:DUF1508 domain-containing protein [Salidesulfovibrio onnuriiensis]
MYKFELFKDRAGEWRFRLVAPNGKIMLQSEGYTQKHSAIETIESIKENAKHAEIVEV